MGGFLAFAETWTICQQHATNGYLLIAETTILRKEDYLS
jgi:hypothetical protein